MAVRRWVGEEHEERLVQPVSAPGDIVDRLFGEEIDRMAGVAIALAIVDHVIVVERQNMADLQGHPLAKAVLRLIGDAEMILADQRRVVAETGEAFGQGIELPDGVPSFRPLRDLGIVEPGVNAMLRWDEAGEHRGPAG